MADHGFPALNLHPLLKPYPSTEIFMDVDHLSPRGHEIVSLAIAEWLEREKLVPPL